VYQNNKEQHREFFNHYLKIIKPSQKQNFWWSKVSVKFLYIFFNLVKKQSGYE
tara:strand:- start:755 stop:913 length:159 start_codon:yes stop_codon:yes gene_type:complete